MWQAFVRFCTLCAVFFFGGRECTTSPPCRSHGVLCAAPQIASYLIILINTQYNFKITYGTQKDIHGR